MYDEEEEETLQDRIERFVKELETYKGKPRSVVEALSPTWVRHHVDYSYMDYDKFPTIKYGWGYVFIEEDEYCTMVNTNSCTMGMLHNRQYVYRDLSKQICEDINQGLQLKYGFIEE